MKPLPDERSRVAWIDRARGVALLAMIVFHFSFDLAMFGHVEWDVGGYGPWRWFAMAIAGSFIAMSGVSMQIAHERGIRWRAFWWREAQLATAAVLVTVATHVAMGSAVWFGILHAITLFSLLVLPFLFAPSSLVALSAIFTVAAPRLLTSEVFFHPLLYPLGLSPVRWPSLDYEPVFPWFGAMLVGVLVARVAPLPARAPAMDPLARAGRHSLLIYLLHQPILISLLLLHGHIASV